MKNLILLMAMAIGPSIYAQATGSSSFHPGDDGITVLYVNLWDGIPDNEYVLVDLFPGVEFDLWGVDSDNDGDVDFVIWPGLGWVRLDDPVEY